MTSKETKPKHTPGPWKVAKSIRNSESKLVYIRINSKNKDVVSTTCVYGSKNNSKIPDEEANANARLIAAAPELLAIVKRLFYSINGLSATYAATDRAYACSILRKETSEAIRLSEKAIAKATGGRDE